MIWRIDGVSAHMVEGLAGLLCALVVAAAPLIVGVVEPPGAGFHVDPSIRASQVEHLPRLQLDGLSGIHTAHLVALSEPAKDAVCSGHIEYIREIWCTLALQVIQVALTRQDLILATLRPELSGHNALGILADRMVQAGLSSSRHRDHPPVLRPCLKPVPRVSGPAARVR